MSNSYCKRLLVARMISCRSPGTGEFFAGPARCAKLSRHDKGGK